MAKAKKRAPLPKREKIAPSRQEDFSPKAAPPPAVPKRLEKIPPSPDIPLDLSQHKTPEQLLEQKKRTPHAAHAVLLSGGITLAAAAFFLFIQKLDPVLTLEIALPIFIGFSILIYNALESKG